MTDSAQPESNNDCGTPTPIPAGARLLRSVAHDADALEWSADAGQWLPTARAVRFDPECSVYWREHLEVVHQLAPGSVGTSNRPLVFQVGADAVRGIEFGVRHTPDAETPIDCAHTSIDGPGGIGTEPPKSARRAFRSAMADEWFLVAGEISFAPPPDA